MNKHKEILPEEPVEQKLAKHLAKCEHLERLNNYCSLHRKGMFSFLQIITRILKII